jgi:hypothetical protein
VDAPDGSGDLLGVFYFSSFNVAYRRQIMFNRDRRRWYNSVGVMTPPSNTNMTYVFGSGISCVTVGSNVWTFATTWSNNKLLDAYRYELTNSNPETSYALNQIASDGANHVLVRSDKAIWESLDGGATFANITRQVRNGVGYPTYSLSYVPVSEIYEYFADLYYEPRLSKFVVASQKTNRDSNDLYGTGSPTDGVVNALGIYISIYPSTWSTSTSSGTVTSSIPGWNYTYLGLGWSCSAARYTYGDGSNLTLSIAGHDAFTTRLWHYNRNTADVNNPWSSMGMDYITNLANKYSTISRIDNELFLHRSDRNPSDDKMDSYWTSLHHGYIYRATLASSMGALSSTWEVAPVSAKLELAQTTVGTVHTFTPNIKVNGVIQNEHFCMMNTQPVGYNLDWGTGSSSITKNRAGSEKPGLVDPAYQLVVDTEDYLSGTDVTINGYADSYLHNNATDNPYASDINRVYTSLDTPITVTGTGVPSLSHTWVRISGSIFRYTLTANREFGFSDYGIGAGYAAWPLVATNETDPLVKSFDVDLGTYPTATTAVITPTISIMNSSMAAPSESQAGEMVTFAITTNLSNIGTAYTLDVDTNRRSFSTVEVRIDGVLKATFTSFPSQYAFDTNSYVAGTHTIAANGTSLTDTDNDSYNFTGTKPAPTPINFGDTLAGTIDNSDPLGTFRSQPTDVYTFTNTGSSKDVIIRMIATGNWDTYLYLANSSYSQIAADNDSAGSGNSQITYLGLPVGTYYIECCPYGAGRGGYTIQLIDNS